MKHTRAESATNTLLLTLCRAELTPAQAGRAQALLDRPVDWPLLAELACLHGVVSLVYRNLMVLADASGTAPALASEASWQLMRRAAAQVAFDGMLQLRQLAQSAQALRSVGIEPILLKGQALADLLYSDPVLRPSADIDLLVERDQLLAACAALETIGYRAPSQGEIDFQLVNSYDLALLAPALAGRPVLVELHWRLAPRGLFAIDLNVWRARAQPFSLNGLTMRRLSPEDALLHLAMHMRKHRYVGLRWLCDISELVRRFADDLDWDYTLSSSNAAGLRTLLYTSLSLAADLLEAPVPAGVLHSLAPSGLRRRWLRSLLSRNVLLTPVEREEAGWTRLAPAELLLLDRPDAMLRELRHRLLPPAERLAGAQASDMRRGQRLALGARRLVHRTATLLRR